MLPFPIRFAVQADLALNAIAAVVGPQHVLLVQQPIAQFGVLVTAGIILHEIIATIGRASESVRRRWRRRR
ncbi:MAG TPA: hypothetical protein VND19_25880 [Acetobacteraceae bacterium]|nr:hypothetical protein [Acetobacteraceae bacterium]